MTYATIADVQRLFHANAGYVIGTTSVPSQADVEAWLTEFEAELDGLLKTAGYSVPASGTRDMVRLRRIVAEATACKTWSVAFPVDTDQLPAQTTRWCETWSNTVKALEDGTFTLVDQSRRGGIGAIYPTMMFDED